MWFVHLPDVDLAYLPQGIKEFDEYIEAVQWAQRFALIRACRRIQLEVTEASNPSPCLCICPLF